MKIEVLGMGCPKCNSLESEVKKAVSELALDAEIIKISEVQEIVARGGHEHARPGDRWPSEVRRTHTKSPATS